MNKKIFILFFIMFVFVIISSFTLSIFPALANQITGKASSSGIITFRILPFCNAYVNKGWNLISLCSIPENKTIAKVLENISYRYVLEWNEQNQSFEVYSPLREENPFNEFNLNKSYFIYFNQPYIFSITGKRFNDTIIPLARGWNAVNYPYEFSVNVSRYLQSIDKKYRYVMKWNSSTQKFLIYSPLASSKEFEKIFMGEGQFILMLEPSYLYYNRTLLENG